MSRSEFEGIIAEFQKNFPRPMVSALVVEWYDIEREWPNKWTSGNLPGVYFFFDSDENLLYIGKASSGRTLKKRLSGYFKNRQGPCRKIGKAKDVRYVGLLPLPADNGFEAPAIEEYLITYCRDPGDYPRFKNAIIVNKHKRKLVNDEIDGWIKNPENAPEELRARIIELKNKPKASMN